MKNKVLCIIFATALISGNCLANDATVDNTNKDKSEISGLVDRIVASSAVARNGEIHATLVDASKTASDLESLGIKATQAKHIDVCRSKFNVLPDIFNIEHDIKSVEAKHVLLHGKARKVLSCLGDEEKAMQLSAGSYAESIREGLSAKDAGFQFECRENLGLPVEGRIDRSNHATITAIDECSSSKHNTDHLTKLGALFALFITPVVLIPTGGKMKRKYKHKQSLKKKYTYKQVKNQRFIDQPNGRL